MDADDGEGRPDRRRGSYAQDARRVRDRLKFRPCDGYPFSHWLEGIGNQRRSQPMQGWQ